MYAFDNKAPPPLDYAPPPARRRLIVLLLLVLAAHADAVDFQQDVEPILAKSCYQCHGPEKQKGGLRLDLRESALGGGDDGIAIIPTHGVDSPLIRYVSGADPDRRMPPKGDLLSAQQVSILRAWIDAGAQWPRASTRPTGDPKLDHWAFKPLAKPPVPAIQNGSWARTPVDAFILAKLESTHLSPSPAADKRTLIRRVYFDLIGLPPTPQDVAAFVADDSTDAYERIVDRLLASPRYGERWARHWMDVIHFAETHGNDQDRERPNAWPYRDYLVRSFNADKPYARFVQEQIAGDVLYPHDPQATVALGFVAAGPWDESSQMEIQDDTIDKKVARNLDRDDMVSTVMSTFTSTTVHCARCHNHKFDPISQAEYYGLQAVFAGVDRADRPYDPDENVHAQRRSLLAQKHGLAVGEYVAEASPLDAKVRAQAAAWEREVKARKSAWAVLDPAEMKSTAGTPLTKLADHSILSGGARPERDTYTITAPTELKRITAIRLELLPDDSLPAKGPGRAENGNLHLNEFTLSVAPRSNPATSQPAPIATARADVDQDGWTITMAINGKPETAWGIHPHEGKRHVGVFELKQPVGFADGSLLTFALEQSHGRGHVIGRLRLSATDAATPVPADAESLPPPIARILATPSEQRTEADQLALATHYLQDQIERQLKALAPVHYVYAASSEFAPRGNFKPTTQPRPVSVLKRGDVNQPLEPAESGAISCVPGLPTRFAINNPRDESERRPALANWLTDPRNALTWRSIVNRVWHYHFGRGIVSTPNDFGHMGAAPTHPELLDWLATWFIDHGGSLKQLHRLIVTSSTYRQSSQFNADYARLDADNQYLWRMNRSRLDAESVRDAVLQISGLLDLTMGGPSAKHFLQSPGVHVTPVLDYASFDVDAPAARRLSIYRFIYRTLPDPFMDTLDCPDASQFAPVRSTSVTALQALAMFNDRFILRYSEHLAERVSHEAADLPAQIARAYELCLNRAPTEKESAALSAYATKHGLPNACRLILNSNEFMFLD